jgi:hypothetical protein
MADEVGDLIRLHAAEGQTRSLHRARQPARGEQGVWTGWLATGEPGLLYPTRPRGRSTTTSRSRSRRSGSTRPSARTSPIIFGHLNRDGTVSGGLKIPGLASFLSDPSTGTSTVVQGLDSGAARGPAPGAGRRHRRLELRADRRHGQQRRHRDPHGLPRQRRGALRSRDRHQHEERVLRHPDRRPADDRPGRRGRDHQHLVGARGLANAGQRALPYVEGRHADAHPHRRGWSWPRTGCA